jgi:hypothetical protein
MRVWKTLTVACVAMAFSAAAQAECGGALNKTATNKNATGKLTTNKLAGNKLAGNKLAGNKLAGNGLAGNGLSANRPGDGAASNIVAIELANGERLLR